MREKGIYMNYDTATGLPTIESFLDFSDKMRTVSDSERFAFLAVSPDSYLNLYTHTNFQLHLFIKRFIRKHHDYMLSACKWNNNTYVIFLDLSHIDAFFNTPPVSRVIDILTQNLEDFTENINSAVINAKMRFFGGLCFLGSNITDSLQCIEKSISAQKSSRSTATKGASIALYHSNLGNILPQAQDSTHILPLFEDSLSNNHLIIYLQPKFEINNSSVIGAEALVRIMDNTNRILKPTEFLPILNRYGISYKLDLIVLEKMLKLIEHWEKEHLKIIPISINLSATDFVNKDFFKILNELTEKYSYSKKYINFEISCDSYIEAPERMTEHFDVLQQMGYHIVLDNFKDIGSITSPLNMAHVDMINLNHSSFYYDLSFSGKNINLKDYIILFEDCNISVIYKQLESADSLNFARECGINYGQGYYFDRPLPLDIFEKKYMEYDYIYDLIKRNP